MNAKVARRRLLAPKDRRLFVLDTNVLLHDPMSVLRFQEHDIFLPILVLEELDRQKKGTSETARNARQASRLLDRLITQHIKEQGNQLAEGIPLAGFENLPPTMGRLFLQTEIIPASTLPLIADYPDNQILAVVNHLQKNNAKRDVFLVSKDINMRIKAHALNINAEDYFNDQVLQDTDILYTGITALPENFWERHEKSLESWQEGGHTMYRIAYDGQRAPYLNEMMYWQPEGEKPFYARVTDVDTLHQKVVLQTLKDYTHAKNAVWGITARNREQNFAMNLLMNPDIDLVTMVGQAGTGKTLLALASGLMLAIEHKKYSEIIITRATIPVGEDIGFLPGTEEEKMTPWMGALEDNLEVLQHTDEEVTSWQRAATLDLLRTHIKIKSLNFMRGRTFINKFLIIDEAQNLTSKQMKTLITRAGVGTKIVCLGNLAQIDTPYLSESNSGLTYVVDRMKNWGHAGHVTLARGERSRLADYAAEIL
ncbi:MAG: PhoH family protein [Burkholderiales bacterium]|jgi:PhoH-like ATPase|nr:PhoH family protein [Burkholderiales bacterium]